MIRLLILCCFVTGLTAAETQPTVPADWQASVAGDGSTQVWRSPDGLAAIAVARRAGEGRDATAHVDEALATLAAVGSEFTLISGDAQAEGLPEGWRQARYRLATGERTWQQLLIIGPLQRQMIAVTCSAPDADFATWQATFTAALPGLLRTPSRLGSD